MSDFTVSRIDDMESVYGGLIVRARAELGVSSLGMQVSNLPPNFEASTRKHDGMPMTDMTRICCRAVVSLALVFATPLLAGGADPFPGVLPGVDIGGLLPSGFEPSGAAWHPRLQQLLVVSDDGFVAALDAEGALFATWTVGQDLEAVTVADAAGPFIYLGIEHPDAIFEFDIEAGSVTRQFDLTGTLSGPNARGLESLTFVPDAGHPEGGVFLAGLQEDGRVYSFDLPIVSSSTSTAVSHVSTFAPVAGRDDLSGLAWVESEATLYAAYDSHDLLRAMQQDGTFIGEWSLPGTSQEGIAFVGCALFVTHDQTAEVLRYAFPTVQLDEDLDGHVDCLDNCPEDGNPAQIDTDGDRAGDACDCAPADPSASEIPGDVRQLVLGKSTGQAELSWSASASRYDAVRGSGSDMQVEGGLDSALCSWDDVPGSSVLDGAPPPAAGDFDYYVVRGQNTCGSGTYGTSSAGSERSIAADCP